MITAIVAMDCEAEILLKNATIIKETTILGKKAFEGEFYGIPFSLMICGIGKVNAAIGTSAAILTYQPDALLNFGVAGGLNKSTRLCSVYSIEKAVQFDFDLTKINGTKIGTLDEYAENYFKLSSLPDSLAKIFEPRALATADKFNDSPDDYQLLTEELFADIRDMEGCAVVQTAQKAGVPIYAFKAISDVAGNGSTPEQYMQNRSTALSSLENALPDIFKAII